MFFLSKDVDSENQNEDFEQVVNNNSSQTDTKSVNDNGVQASSSVVNTGSQTDIPEVVKNNNVNSETKNVNWTKYMENEFDKFTKECDNKLKQVDDVLFNWSNQLQGFLDKQFNK